MKKISRTLYLRGMHRSFGNSALGTFTGFLTVIFFIRISVNLFFIYDLGSRGVALDIPQITGAYLIFLSAYAILAGPLAALRISFAMPGLSFIDYSPGREDFRSEFMRQAVLLRPMNIVSIVIFSVAAFVFTTVGDKPWVVLAMAFIVLFAVIISYRLIFKAAERVTPSLPEIQVLELLYLLVIVMRNPDIRNVDGVIRIFFIGLPYSFDSYRVIGLTLVLFLLVSIVILLLLKIISNLSGKLRGKTSLSIFENWYWRFFKAKFWIFLYFIILPIQMLPVFSQKIKIWSLLVFLFFSAVSYLYFISQCENFFREKMRCSIFENKNIKLIRRSLYTHIFLMLVPVAVFIILNMIHY